MGEATRFKISAGEVEVTPTEAKYLVKKYYQINYAMARVAEELAKQGVPFQQERFNILFLGPPGVGKTSVVRRAAEEIAKEMGKIFVDLSEASDEMIDEVIRNPSKYFVFYRIIPSHMNPEDIAFPLPNAKKGYVNLLLLKKLAVLKNTDGIVFIDEITNIARPDVQTLFFALVNEGELEGVKLSPRIMFVAAGNPPEEEEGGSSVAQALPSPLLTRFTILRFKTPTVKEWVRHMNSEYKDAWDKRVAAFLTAFPNYMFESPPAEGLEPYPTPRSWTKLALLLKALSELNAPEELIRKVIVGTVGPKAGFLFIQFLDVMKDLPPAEELLKNPGIIAEKWHSDRMEDKLYAIAATYAVAEYLARMYSETKDASIVSKAREIADTLTAMEAGELAAIIPNVLPDEMLVELFSEELELLEEIEEDDVRSKALEHMLRGMGLMI